MLVIASGEKTEEKPARPGPFRRRTKKSSRIQKENWFDYDVVISTPDMMKSVGKLGKSLGTKRIDAQPEGGTVTFNVKEAVADIKKGRVEFRVDKSGSSIPASPNLSFDTINRRKFQGVHRVILKVRTGH